MKKKIQNKTKELKNFIFDLVFPKFCLSCETEGTFLCTSCFEKIRRQQTQNCPWCPRITKYGGVCSWHQDKKTDLPITGIIVAAHYEEPLKSLIHELKYNSIRDLINPLGTLLIESIERVAPHGKYIISSVPLHFMRKNHRGFNQAELLAKMVSKKFGWNYQELIKRKFSKKHQVQLSGQKRRQSLINKFKVSKFLNGEKILLVDDVSTTGATLVECAKVLKAAGASEVWGLVLARG